MTFQSERIIQILIESNWQISEVELLEKLWKDPLDTKSTHQLDEALRKTKRFLLSRKNGYVYFKMNVDNIKRNDLQDILWEFKENTCDKINHISCLLEKVIFEKCPKFCPNIKKCDLNKKSKR